MKANQLFSLLPEKLQKIISDRVIDNSDLLILLSRLYFGSGTLRKKGWFKSCREGVPIDASGRPLPWYTYSAIDFLEPRLTKNHRVFEYGCGYSTLWFANRVGSVVAVEDSMEWAQIVKGQVPENGSVIYRGGKDNYIREVSKYGLFDIVVIDGSYRTECVEYVVPSLSDEGVIIWDDIEWRTKEDYRQLKPEYEELIEHGFSILPFYGLKPDGGGISGTAIFYRTNNCLGI